MADIYDDRQPISSRTDEAHNAQRVVGRLLPIAIKMRDVPLKRRNAQREHNRMVSQNVLQHVLQPLLNSETRTFYARCADGNFRHCYSTLAAWMADYPEHRDLHNIKNGVCYWCECPKQEMGNLPHQHERHNLQDHNMYRMLSDSNTPLSIAELKRHDVNPGFNILWYLDCVTSDLPKPDLLHTMQIGMLKHLLTWLHNFSSSISGLTSSTIFGSRCLHTLI
jgi:hypothetical protein